MQRVNFENGSYVDQGDCLELMPNLADRSVDLILCDLPYGTTACSWDSVIPFEPLWANYKRIIKPNGAIVLFGSQPFTTLLIASNLPMFRYDWIYEKTKSTGFFDIKKRPLNDHENICVFYKKQVTFNPQMTKASMLYNRGFVNRKKSDCYGNEKDFEQKESGLRYPKRIIKINNANTKEVLHPTQKPVALLEYLIKTYSNEGELVLDNTMGSGSTCVAAVKTKRNFIGFEKEAKYFDIACKRINDAYKQQTIF